MCDPETVLAASADFSPAADILESTP